MNKKKWKYADVDSNTLIKIIKDEYNSIINNKFDDGFIKWTNWVLDGILLPAVFFDASKVAGIIYTIIGLCNRTFALPWSTSDKIKYHKKFIISQ